MIPDIVLLNTTDIIPEFFFQSTTGMIPNIYLLIMAIACLILSFKVVRSAVELAVNAIAGVILFFIASTIGIVSTQVSVMTLLVCAIGGVPAALVLIILNMLGLH
jgi:inhibitor of the pro-sigma K processing machinery